MELASCVRRCSPESGPGPGAAPLPPGALLAGPWAALAGALPAPRRLGFPELPGNLEEFGCCPGSG